MSPTPIGVTLGERQISRRGGVGKICSDVVDGAVDMALHPVETIGMAWEGMFWMGGALGNAVNFVKDYCIVKDTYCYA